MNPPTCGKRDAKGSRFRIFRSFSFPSASRMEILPFHVLDQIQILENRDGTGIGDAPLFNYLYREFVLGNDGDAILIAQTREDPPVALRAQVANRINLRLENKT